MIMASLGSRGMSEKKMVLPSMAAVASSASPPSLSSAVPVGLACSRSIPSECTSTVPFRPKLGRLASVTLELTAVSPKLAARR